MINVESSHIFVKYLQFYAFQFYTILCISTSTTFYTKLLVALDSKCLLTVFALLIVIPYISPEVMDQTQNEGDTASFTCQATGEPVPTISWYYNNTLLVNGAKYMITEMSLNTIAINNTLTIMSVQSSDVGTYTCNATNVVSSDTSSGVFTVNGECANKFSILFSC